MNELILAFMQVNALFFVKFFKCTRRKS